MRLSFPLNFIISWNNTKQNVVSVIKQREQTATDLDQSRENSPINIYKRQKTSDEYDEISQS